MIETLRSELADLRREIAAAKAKSATLAGGLVKVLVEARLETLNSTEALVNQRVHALESGGKITVEAPGTEPDQALADRLEVEVAQQMGKLESARVEEARYSGGLVAAMKSATTATEEQTLAMLHQKHLAACYGLVTSTAIYPSASEDEEKDSVSLLGEHRREAQDLEGSEVPLEILGVRLIRKQFAEQDYQEFIFFDLEFSASGLQQPSRAIKGVLVLRDLFGESKMKVNWSVDKPLDCGQIMRVEGTGFEFNQFMDEHRWVLSTELEDMSASFLVTNILYQDGSRSDF